MEDRILHMSQKELDRVTVLERLNAKQLSQIEAARRLGLSTRQVRRLQSRYEALGAAGLASARRGKPSNNQLKPSVRAQAIELVSVHYRGFGPTLAHEKLTEDHGLQLSVESLRKAMIGAKLWKGRSRKVRKTVQQMRTRRPCFGELVQIDGSLHDWLEGRGPRCCLLVFVDDATSRLLALHFVEHECRDGYFEAVRQHMKSHGRPLAYYSDKHAIFRVNTPEAESGTGETQFGRACKELGIELICANTPQAKGRVERANSTLQDRLVKDMRLTGINNIEDANAFLPEFIERYNQRFGKPPADPYDAHRPVGFTETVLNRILCVKETRQISKQLEFSYNAVTYQIQLNSPGHHMKKGTVTICDLKGDVTAMYKGKVLTCKAFDKKNRPTKTIESKKLNSFMDQKSKAHKPKPDHPWRTPGHIRKNAA